MAEDSELARLIGQLGADSLADRDRAQARLLAVGRSAQRSLEAATLAQDAEIAGRARAILKELNRKPNRGFSATELTWTSIFATRRGVEQVVYCIVGTGFMGVPSVDSTAVLIERWLNEHSRARAVPISTIESDRPDQPAWTYLWIEDDNENLNLHLIEQGAFTGFQMESPNDERMIGEAEYEDFLAKARKAQRKARLGKFGIWSDDFNLSTALIEPWQVRSGACLFEQEYAEAIVELKAGLGDASPSLIWAAIAECYDKRGDYPETIAAYDRSLADGITERAALGKAGALSRRDGHEEGAAWLKSLRGATPSGESADLWVGRFHKSEKRYGSAIEVLAPHFDELCKDSSLGFDSQGMLAEGGGSKDPRWEVIEVAGELAECQLLARDLKAAVLTATKGISAAQKWMKDDDDDDPAEAEAGDAKCRFIRAQVYEALGRNREAMEDLDKSALLASPFSQSELRSAIKKAKKELSRKTGN